MTQNTSSKICISKRLTITALLLIALGFSVIVFSTLSSSVNKTTSSKAEAPASAALKDFGGKNQPCAIDPQDRFNYFCNQDTSLVCDGPLDFWLSSDAKKAQMRKEDKGPRCIEPVDILMGKEGQPCREAVSGTKQCEEKLVCVDVISDKLGNTFSRTYENYFRSKYLGKEIYSVAWAIDKYFHFERNPTDGSLVGTYGVCIPDNFSKVESCGDEGQNPCKNELGQDFCFGENRVVIDRFEYNEYKCAAKNKVTGKGLLKCDDASKSCNEFCSGQNARCVETCEDKLMIEQGGEAGAKEVSIKAGLFEEKLSDRTNKGAKYSGTCSQTYAPAYPDTQLNIVCSLTHKTYCCCDKIK